MSNIKILLRSKKHTTKDGKRNFRSYFTIAKFKEGDSVVEKSVTIKFTKAVNTNSFTNGYIMVPDTQLSLPYSYEVKTNADGSKEYPTIWVREVVEYIPKEYKVNPNRFVTDEDEDDESLPF